MNVDPADRKLDNLLHDWARSRQADSARVDALTQRVVVDFEQARTSGVAAEPVRAVPSGPLWGMVLAACAAVGLVLHWVGDRPRLGGSSDRTQGAGSPAALLDSVTKEQRSAKWELLRELNDVYDRRIAWFVETKDRLGLELQSPVDDRPPAAETAAPVLVRVVIQSRPRGTGAWSVVRSLDIVTSNEQVVRLSPELVEHTSLSLWVFRLPDGMLHVESQGSFEADAAIRWDSMAPVKDGQALHVAHGTAGQTEFQVWQVAATLTPSSS